VYSTRYDCENTTSVLFLAVLTLSVFPQMFFLNRVSQFLETIDDNCDPVSWILDTGKELERACEFAVALKFYFAGKMFFARWKHHVCLQDEASLRVLSSHATAPASKAASVSDSTPASESSAAAAASATARIGLPKWKQHKKDFERLYEHLLPMTNAEVTIFHQIIRSTIFPHFTASYCSLCAGLCQCSGIRSLPKRCPQARHNEQVTACIRQPE
jgi:hypothetical protein